MSRRGEADEGGGRRGPSAQRLGETVCRGGRALRSDASRAYEVERVTECKGGSSQEALGAQLRRCSFLWS